MDEWRMVQFTRPLNFGPVSVVAAHIKAWHADASDPRGSVVYLGNGLTFRVKETPSEVSVLIRDALPGACRS